MKLNIPRFDNQLSSAIWLAKRAGKEESPVYEGTADAILKCFVGGNPPTKTDLMNGKMVSIGHNSNSEWYGIVTETGRHILYSISEDDTEYDDSSDEPSEGWDSSGTYFCSNGYSSTAEEIKTGDPIPSYRGHY
jgi:hypothetical protein